MHYDVAEVDRNVPCGTIIDSAVGESMFVYHYRNMTVEAPEKLTEGGFQFYACT